MPNWKKLITSGSDATLNSLSVTNTITASIFSGSQYTGSLFGTSSWSKNSITASYVENAASFPYTGSAKITGSLDVVGTSTITGSLNVSGSTVQIGNNLLVGNTILSGTLQIQGQYPASIGSQSVSIIGNANMNGYLRFDPVTSILNTQISGGYIYVTSSTGDLYFAQNIKGSTNNIRLRWIEGNLYSGLLNGGLITTQSSTVYQVSSGSGIIVTLNATLADDPYPVVDFISWPNLSASISPLSASYDQSFIAIEKSGITGVIYTQGIPYDDGQFNTLIPIGNVIHQNRSTINATATYPSVAYAYKQRSSDFIRAFGALKLSGLNTYPSGSSTGSLTISSGTAYSDGRNYIVDPNNPSYVSDQGQPISKIYKYYSSGSGFVYLTNGGIGYQTIDPGLYNNNGTLTTVSNNKWSLQRVFYFPGGATKGIYVYYGNAVYDSQLEAIANIPTENFTEASNTAASAVLSAILVVQGNADFTNSSTYSIRQGGLFRNVGGTGGGTTTTNKLSDLSDVNIVSPTNAQALVYNSTTLKWENSSYLSASISGNANTATTASYASTASLAINFLTSSVTNATSASYAATASSGLATSTVGYNIGGSQIYYASILSSTSATNQNIFSNNTGSFTSAFYNYTVYSGSNARAGQISAVWLENTVSYSDYSTTDLGNTLNVTASVIISTSQTQLNIQVPASSVGWNIKATATYI